MSSTWLEGRYYSALNTIHALTVILGLMYIPFGKLFHIFQRPANLGVQYYKRANATGEQAACRRCGEPFAGALHVADLKEVLDQLGFTYGDGDGRQLPGHLPGLPAPPGRAGAVGAGRRFRLMAKPPRHRGGTDREPTART